MPSTDMKNSLNALDTRDITLPRRLWSWLVTQAKKNDESVDEVIVRLIDMYRHPEVATPDLDSADMPTEIDPPQEKKEPASASNTDTTDSSRPQGAPPPSANAEKENQSGSDGPDTYSASDRLRKASDRLQHLMNKGKEKTSSQSSGSDMGKQIQELLKNNDKLQTLEPLEPVSKKDPNEGVSMFDMAAEADDDKDGEEKA